MLNKLWEAIRTDLRKGPDQNRLILALHEYGINPHDLMAAIETMNAPH